MLPDAFAEISNTASRGLRCNSNRIGLRYLFIYSRCVSAIMDSQNVKLQEWPSVASVVCGRKRTDRNGRVWKCSQTERNSYARAYDEKVVRMSWCEFNSGYKRKLSWNSPTRRSKSRQRNLPSSREIYESRSIYRSTGSRTRAIIDVLNLPTWPTWSRVRVIGKRSGISRKHWTSAVLSEGKLYAGMFYLFIYFLINWNEICAAKEGEVWSSEIRWNRIHSSLSVASF